MILHWILVIIAILIILILGIATMASFKDFINTLEKPMLFAMSWLIGCFAIAASSLVFYLISFFGGPSNVVLIVGLPLLVLVFFRRNIMKNILELTKSDWKYNEAIKWTPSNIIWFSVFALIVIFCILVIVLNSVKPAWAWDTWMIWSLKAKLLFYDCYGRDFLTNYSYDYVHLDYPIFVPFLQAYIAKFIGIFDERFNQIFYSLTYVSYLIVLYHFIKKFFQGALAILLLLPFMFAPVLVLNVTAAYADAVVSTFHLMVLFFLYEYFRTDKIDNRLLFPVSIGLASLLMIKNEGTVITGSLFITSFIVSIFITKDVRERYKPLLIAFLITPVVHIPWVLLSKSLGIANRFVSVRIIESSDIHEMLGEVPVIIKFLFNEVLFKQEYWGLIFYIFLVFLVIGIIRKCYLELILFIGSLFIFMSVAVATYVISPHDLVTHLYSSLDRVILSISPMAICFMISILADKKASETEEHSSA